MFRSWLIRPLCAGAPLPSRKGSEVASTDGDSRRARGGGYGSIGLAHIVAA